MLDEVETLQRVRGDVREKGLNALRQLIDEIDAGRFPGLYLVITGTPAFFDGPQGVQRLAPLAQRLHVDFTDRRPVRQPPRRADPAARFDLDQLASVGCRVRDIYAKPPALASGSRLARGRRRTCAISLLRWPGELGGKVGIAPRLFLKKLVADVLDRVDQFEDFDPRRHYALTLAETELTAAERAARRADSSTTSSCDGDPGSTAAPGAAAPRRQLARLAVAAAAAGAAIDADPRGARLPDPRPHRGRQDRGGVLPVLSRMLTRGLARAQRPLRLPDQGAAEQPGVAARALRRSGGTAVGLWHGDVVEWRKGSIRQEPPDSC